MKSPNSENQGFHIIHLVAKSNLTCANKIHVNIVYPKSVTICAFYCEAVNELDCGVLLHASLGVIHHPCHMLYIMFLKPEQFSSSSNSKGLG